MKRILLFLVIFTLPIFSIRAQFSQLGSTLVKKDGEFKIFYNNREFNISEHELIIKTKPEFIGELNLEVIRKDKLGFTLVKVPSDRIIDEFAKELWKTGIFEVVEFNSFFEYTSVLPNDSWIGEQWNLAALNVYDAWDFTMGDPSIVVAVLDMGVYWDQTDLGMGVDGYQNIFLNPGEDPWTDENNPISGNGVDDDNNGKEDDWKGWNFCYNSNETRPYNYLEHGTFIAGIISAKTNNSNEIAGIAGGNSGPGVKILPVSIGDDTIYSAIISEAIYYSIEMGAKIIQLSIAGLPSTQLNAAIEYAYDHNVIVICSSGNSNEPIVSYPASFWAVLSVGATTNSNERWIDLLTEKGSDYGNNLDIVAPGENLCSLGQSIPKYNTGTSFAAPEVSAIAALCLSLNNSLEVPELTDIIISTAQKIEGYDFTILPGNVYSWNEQVGYGLIDADSALQVAACYTSIENTTYSSQVSLTGCSSIEMVDVKVKNGGKLTIGPTTSLVILGPFQVELGAELDVQ